MAGPVVTPVDGAELARLAAASVAARLQGVPPDGRPPAAQPLRALGASFVTLERQGKLRGCVGTLDAACPLYIDVRRNARRAMADPRLPPVTGADWPHLDVKVSVLSRPEPMPVANRGQLVEQLRPGQDGLLLTGAGRRSTFLPSVWEKLADPDKFLAALLVKGGWSANGWPAGIAVVRYTSAEFADHAPRAALEPMAG